jgi:hypothetical protein
MLQEIVASKEKKVEELVSNVTCVINMESLILAQDERWRYA